MTTPPNEFEEWLLQDFGSAVSMIEQRLERVRTVAELDKVRDEYAPKVLGMFRKMFGTGLAAEADERLAAARAQVVELIARRAAQLKPKSKQ